MPESSPADLHFLNQLNEVIAHNLPDEHFGVTELAEAMNMSRSNLLRKVKKSTSLPVNQLIREARLKRAMELLQNTASNVSEVSHQVGFNSTSYFIKCFREHYGYPPGETGKRNTPEPTPSPEVVLRSRQPFTVVALAGAVVVLIACVVFYVYRTSPSSAPERSIVVLPFKNESNDSTNVYLINGLMESTLSNLQKIEDLRVLSRTSSEKYRNTSKSIAEMANELDVRYFIEGSGQKIGNEILLNIQLIEGRTDKHLWAKQYKRKAEDIFALQQEVAKNIAEEIEVVISPEAKKRIEKIPTQNLEAYDLYLKGKELFFISSAESLQKSIPYYKKAIALDDRFASAYAQLVMVEYYLDIFQWNKKYKDEITAYADKALLFDPRSSESLIAKALSYAQNKEYPSAVLYLEKALEYNPHSGFVYHFLTEFYSLFVPDPPKYLEYALRNAHEDRVTLDSQQVGFKFFHAANAMVQAGFVDEGIRYVDQSMAYDPKHFFSPYVSVLFRFAKSKDMEVTKKDLIAVFNRDTTRADIMKELAKICYIQRDYARAHYYYQKFIVRSRELNLDIYQEENLSICLVLKKLGKPEEAKEYLQKYKTFVDTEKSIYKHLLLAMYYIEAGDRQKGLDEFRTFSKEDNYTYWILFVDKDPLFDSLQSDPEFQRMMKLLRTKFWERNQKIKKDLEEKGLYPFEEYLPLTLSASIRKR